MGSAWEIKLPCYLTSSICTVHRSHYLRKEYSEDLKASVDNESIFSCAESKFYSVGKTTYLRQPTNSLSILQNRRKIRHYRSLSSSHRVHACTWVTISFFCITFQRFGYTFLWLLNAWWYTIFSSRSPSVSLPDQVFPWSVYILFSPERASSDFSLVRYRFSFTFFFYMYIVA